jgi:hypothetical protein
MSRTLATAFGLLLALGLSSAHANEFAPQMREAFDAFVKPRVQAETTIQELVAMNKAHADLTESEIAALDQAWRKAVPDGGNDRFAAIMDKPCSQALEEAVAASDGLVVEIFVVDRHGLNACQSGLTSDYLQGDETQVQAPMADGPNGEWIGELDWDDSAGSFVAKISRTVTHPDGGRVLGVVVAAIQTDRL